MNTTTSMASADRGPGCEMTGGEGAEGCECRRCVAVRATRAFGKCTIYVQGEFGFNFRRVICRSAEVKDAPYAQFRTAKHVRFMGKGQRRARRFVAYNFGSGHHHPFVVVAGEGPELGPEMFPQAEPGAATVQSHASSCDPFWETEFAKALAASGLKVLERYGV